MKQKRRDSKIDYKGISLFAMAKCNYKNAENYQKALKEYLIGLGFGGDDIDNFLWESIIENRENYQSLIKYLTEHKNKKWHT